ncbi:MAG: TonB-dependent receptor plug domain-containing protein, partial [Chitinophagales bacterium]
MKNILILLGVVLLPGFTMAQIEKGGTGTINPLSGKIVDERTGLPLSGATVYIKGSKETAVSGQDGVFRFSASHKLPVVYVLSYVGYTDQEIRTENAFTNISLSVAAGNNLSDVVVVGYATQKKANITGAVSVLKMSDVAGSRPETDIAHLLQGASPGLQVTFTSGEPGATADLNIRGTTSINGGAPLVLLDNVPVASLSLINPFDIESVTILKDAGSAAIYGARSAWGVMLLTTKKGNRNQQPHF